MGEVNAVINNVASRYLKDIVITSSTLKTEGYYQNEKGKRKSHGEIKF